MSKLMTTYIIGFIVSLVLTMVAYTMVSIHVNSLHETIPHVVLIPTILVIAFIQLGVQLIFFLHLGKEENPKWNVLFFVSTFSAILVVVIASMWIMQHLDYNMTPAQMFQYIQDQGGF